MANYDFKTAGGGQLRLKDDDSERLGPAFRNDDQLIPGTTFKPMTAADRDAFVAALQALDYSTRAVEVSLAHGGYQILANKTMSQDELDAWIEEERKAMAKRIAVTEAEITVTVTEA